MFLLKINVSDTLTLEGIRAKKFGRSSDFLPFRSLPDAMASVAIDVSEKLNGGSQQQDCSGFTPDSLLIPCF